MKIEIYNTESALEKANAFIAKTGLEIYNGCNVPLLNSVRDEFGEEVLNEVFRCLPENDIKLAVHRAFLLCGIN